jgi:hypothetical protein
MPTTSFGLETFVLVTFFFWALPKTATIDKAIAKTIFLICYSIISGKCILNKIRRGLNNEEQKHNIFTGRHLCAATIIFAHPLKKCTNESNEVWRYQCW